VTKTAEKHLNYAVISIEKIYKKFPFQVLSYANCHFSGFSETELRILIFKNLKLSSTYKKIRGEGNKVVYGKGVIFLYLLLVTLQLEEKIVFPTKYSYTKHWLTSELFLVNHLI
jgi:hypothetical protein